MKLTLGQDACGITFEQDAGLNRFPFKLPVRLIEPRTTTVNRVFVPRRCCASSAPRPRSRV